MKREWPGALLSYPSDWVGFVFVDERGWYLYEGTSIGSVVDEDGGDEPAIGVLMMNAHWFDSFSHDWTNEIKGCFTVSDPGLHPLTAAARAMLAIAKAGK